MAVIGFRFIITSNFVIQFYTNLLNASYMKKFSLFVMILLTWSLATSAQNVKTYENKAFSIDYPADWEVTWDSETFVNLPLPTKLSPSTSVTTKLAPRRRSCRNVSTTGCI